MANPLATCNRSVGAPTMLALSVRWRGSTCDSARSNQSYPAWSPSVRHKSAHGERPAFTGDGGWHKSCHVGLVVSISGRILQHHHRLASLRQYQASGHHPADPDADSPDQTADTSITTAPFRRRCASIRVINRLRVVDRDIPRASPPVNRRVAIHARHRHSRHIVLDRRRLHQPGKQASPPAQASASIPVPSGRDGSSARMPDKIKMSRP